MTTHQDGAGAFVENLNALSSGTGTWTVGLPPDSNIAIDDPGQEGMLPTIDLKLDMHTIGQEAIGFIGPVAPNPPDSVGFTSNMQLHVTNDTGQTLHGLILNLANVDQKLPFDLVPPIIHTGNVADSNYAFFADVQSDTFAGLQVSEFSPDGKPTGPGGPAPSKLLLSGNIAPGQTVSGSFILHNTELSLGNNNFVMSVAPA